MNKRKQSTFERLNGGKLNRRERRKLQRQLVTGDPGLSIVHPNAGGIDVGNGSHFVAVPPDRDPNPVQEYGCWTADLVRMAEWLLGCRIDTVAVQATGVYWMPLCCILIERGIRVTLSNARDTKNLPGRKTDIQECQWLMKLHTYGLLRDSFHLEEQMEKVRTIWRLRDRYVKDAGQAVQHMQKALTKMNVQLANVISDIAGVSGQAIIGAILGGERDPYKLADLKHERVQASREEVARSLEGNWREDVLFELRQAVTDYEFAHKQMGVCDQQLEQYLGALPTRTVNGGSQGSEEKQGSGEEPAGEDPAGEKPAGEKKGKGRKSQKARKPQGNAPAFDLKEEQKRIAGVDLTSIDGINVMTVQTILSEVGTDMSAFKTENHFASWLGLTPSKDISGGKVVGPGRRKVQNRVAMSLRLAATTLLRSQSYLGARYRHLRKELPSKTAAVKAMARHLAVLVYRMLTKGEAWVDQGAAKFEQKREDMEMARLRSRAAAKGLKLVPVGA